MKEFTQVKSHFSAKSVANLLIKYIVNLKNHERIHSGKKPFECKTCTKSFSYPSALISHKKFHSGDHRKGLEKHSGVHKNINFYECELCLKIFKHKTSLRNHTDSNHSEIRHKCEICEKEYSSKQELKLHFKCVHEDIKDMKCAHCKKSFVSSKGLRTHIQRGICKIK